MIVSWPQVPDGNIRRPMVYLIGSFTLGSASTWHERAAKLLEPHFGSVFYGIGVGAIVGDFTRWSMLYMGEADQVVLWLERSRPGMRHHWTEFEFGYVLGLARAGRMPPPMIGVSKTMASSAEAISFVMDAAGFQLKIHDDLEELMHAASMAARSMR